MAKASSKISERRSTPRRAQACCHGRQSGSTGLGSVVLQMFAKATTALGTVAVGSIMLKRAHKSDGTPPLVAFSADQSWPFITLNVTLELLHAKNCPWGWGRRQLASEYQIRSRAEPLGASIKFI